MYTTARSDIARLRAYRCELTSLYAEALGRRDLRRARELADLRRRVHRAVLLHEEWHPETAKVPTVAGRSLRGPSSASA